MICMVNTEVGNFHRAPLTISFLQMIIVIIWVFKLFLRCLVLPTLVIALEAWE